MPICEVIGIWSVDRDPLVHLCRLYHTAVVVDHRHQESEGEEGLQVDRQFQLEEGRGKLQGSDNRLDFILHQPFSCQCVSLSRCI